MKQQEKFTPFYGGVFSQWYPSPMVIDGVEYSCAEQYMMAQKALLFGDLVRHRAIMATRNPSEQKAIGRQVKGFDARVWAVVSRDVVMRASLHKFTSDPVLRAKLLLTEGTTLVEASPTDVIWGVGLDEDDPRVHDRSMWRGTNWLGQVLNDLRDSLQAMSSSSCTSHL
ncbi:GTP cyclohydrolase [Stenotrophomonas phage vB_Sm_QDWS359]|uniref:GTP cyclohydrolase n=1 Tax=Stenotrophomonas phage vB_Sm_QDWS359 TaxID=2943841 RepID=A0A9E7DL00_9CAUD|nr:GTP cyclohydrolase [Stenotrophomonas phage vB_Sm_QDWS359]UQM93885.1 GTP cyclohydrolase [Stenotrophomonas phage vB_Sm_QDWS359]